MTVGYITTIVIVIVIMFSSSFSTSSHNVKSDLFYLFSDAKVYSYLFPFPATCWADRLVPCAITISTKLVSLTPISSTFSVSHPTVRCSTGLRVLLLCTSGL